jgi:hypothetical protein
MSNNKKKDENKDEKEDKKFSRRDLVKGLGAAYGLSLIKGRMVSQIVEGFVSSAQADTGLLPNFRYINFYTPGGIPRWYFDLPLIPNGNDQFLLNKQVITSLSIGPDALLKGVYAHTKMGNKFYLPKIWSYPIPLSNGGVGTLNELANSALFLRGVDQGIDGHEFNTTRQNTPIPGGMTYTGLFADSGENPIPAARANSNFEHRSAKNKASIDFNYRADLKVLSNSFNSFKTANPKSFGSLTLAQRTIEAAVKSIQKTQGANSPYMTAIKENRDNAIKLLNSSFDTIDADYSVIYTKYVSLISASLRMVLPGVTDIPVNAISRDPRFNILVSDFNPGVQSSETTGDIRTGFQNIMVSPLAEYLIVKNLSSSVVASLGFFSNFNIQNYYSFDGTTQTYKNLVSTPLFKTLGSDVHSTGTFPALIMFTRHYHAYATCLHELMTVLKSKNLYDKTLIQTTTEFNRIPRNDGSGSDHGFNGSATSLFTGRIKEPIVVGNILVNGSSRGTWGEGAPSSALGQQKVNLGNVVSTICSIFELPTPAPNNPSLVILDSAKIVTPVSKPLNIA